MGLNLMQLTQTVLGGKITDLVSKHFDIDTDKAKYVFDTLRPALIGALVQKADMPDGARALHGAIMAPKVDAHIATNIVRLFDNPISVTNLLNTGSEHMAGLLGDKAAAVAKTVSQQSGTAVGIVTLMASVMAAVIYGLVKQHLQTHGGGQCDLVSTLEDQLPYIHGRVEESVWAALGIGAATVFFDNIGRKLKATLTAFHMDNPPVPAPAPNAPRGNAFEKKTDVAKWRWLWLALIAAALLFFFYNYYGKKSLYPTAPTATPVAASSLAPTFLLRTDKDTQATVVATVASEMEKTAVIDEVKKEYGDKADVTVKVDAAVKPAGWLGKLPEMLSYFKLPDAELQMTGNDIEIGGAAADAKLGITDQTKAILGSGYTISLFDLSQAVATSRIKFEAALVELKPSVCTAADVVKTMNIYTLNFPSGSVAIPNEDALEFAKAVTAIKDCAKDATLEIGGHTDNVGSSVVNMTISQKRADAVRDFFVSKGVAEIALTTKAYGDTKPVADNATANGRFQNRRIEFREQK